MKRLIVLLLLLPVLAFAEAFETDHILHDGFAGNVKYAAINEDGADSDEIVAAVAGKKILVLDYLVHCASAVVITFEDEDGNDLTGAIPLVANGNLAAVASGTPYGLFKTATANKALHLLKGGAVACDGHITYAIIE